MNCLYIVLNSNVARSAGCAGATCRHHRYGDVRFWWPELGIDRLRGCQFDLVTIDLGFRLTSELHEQFSLLFDRRGCRLVFL